MGNVTRENTIKSRVKYVEQMRLAQVKCAVHIRMVWYVKPMSIPTWCGYPYRDTCKHYGITSET